MLSPQRCQYTTQKPQETSGIQTVGQDNEAENHVSAAQ